MLFLTRGQRQIVTGVEARVKAELRSNIPVETLAAEYHIAPSTLGKYFRQAHGISVKEYLTRLRMQHAAELLESTGLSIGAIAERVGYSHQGKFGAAFRRCLGMGPMEYRRQRAALREKRSKNAETELAGDGNL